ncbi:MAG: hypothetical protein H6Q52_2855, partial [Deltaproteobacteria bacterium]|nr:hypothetical protein [Deltaproteobacteria bacterium]
MGLRHTSRLERRIHFPNAFENIDNASPEEGRRVQSLLESTVKMNFDPAV